MGKRTWSLMVVLATVSVLASGCWNNIDITKKAFVTGVGIDRAGEEIKLTLQIVKPSAVATQDGGGSKEEAVWTNTTQGKTMFEAVRKQLDKVARKPDYSHIQVIVIGEGLARAGIKDVLDFLERDQEPRPTANVLVSRDMSAEEVIKLKSDLEKVPAVHIKEVIQNSRARSSIVNQDLFEILQGLQHPGINPVAGIIHPVQQASKANNIRDVEVSGGAVFRRDKLVGWLNPEAAAGLNYLLGKTKGAIVEVENPLSPGKYVAIEQMRVSREVQIQLINGKPHILVTIKGEGNLGDQQGGGDLTTQPAIKALERRSEAKISTLMQKALQSTQKQYGADVFGYGLMVYKEYPKYWQLKGKQWSSEFANLPIKTKVDFKIRMTGFVGPAIREE